MRSIQQTRHVAAMSCLLIGGVLGLSLPARASSDTKELASYPPVTLSVITTDSQDRPVADLKAQDFNVLDNGVTQKDLSIRSTQSRTPTLILLFDLLNSSVQERGYMKQQLHSLFASPLGTGSLDLYLLDATGKLYPVRVVSTGSDHSSAGDIDSQIGALLDQALDKAPLMGPADLKNRVVRTKVTYSALDELCSAIKILPGTKQLLWITYGIPSQIHMTSGWQDLTQYLQQLGGRFNRTSTMVYSLDPGINISSALLNRDGLEILTASTGGQAFASSDLGMALASAKRQHTQLSCRIYALHSR